MSNEQGAMSNVHIHAHVHPHTEARRENLLCALLIPSEQLKINAKTGII
jgi:hypothetical protein